MRVLNQSYFSIVVMALLTACIAFTTISCSSTPKQESTGEYLDDSVITARVKAAILKDKDLKSAEINVETFKGVVQLSGFVSSQSDINKAVSITRDLSGVQSVKNDMRVK